MCLCLDTLKIRAHWKWKICLCYRLMKLGTWVSFAARRLCSEILLAAPCLFETLQRHPAAIRNRASTFFSWILQYLIIWVSPTEISWISHYFPPPVLSTWRLVWPPPCIHHLPLPHIVITNLPMLLLCLECALFPFPSFPNTHLSSTSSNPPSPPNSFLL